MIPRRLRAPVAAAAAAAAACGSCLALINPNYTVVELVRDSGAVCVLRVAAPKDGRIAAEVQESLVGEIKPGARCVLDFSEAEDLSDQDLAAAFGGAPAAVGVMCVLKQKQDGVRVGAVEIGTKWMGLAQGNADDTWKLDRDPNDLETVWGGSARRLVPAIRYALAEQGASFPVAAALVWRRDLPLGKLAGAAHGCIVTEAGVVVACDGGDRVYRAGGKGAPPEDVTAATGLASKSKALAAGDFNADGRVDLASWDGARLWLLARNADGTFAAPAGGTDLAECRSLGATGGGLAAGETAGVALLSPDGKGGFAVRRLAAGSDGGALGPGGVCAVADFNDDGAADILQAFARGLVFYAGERAAGVFAPPVVSRVEVGKRPVALVCGDFDTDGRLDVFAAGEGGATVLSREDGGAWTAITAQTGELGAASGFGQGDATAVAACASDLNGDGRQCAAFFAAAAAPGLFFNRGFACFGVARGLQFSESELAAANALGTGQMTGTLCDLDGDLAPDLLAVDRQSGVWAMFGEPGSPRRLLAAVSLADPAGSPLTVAAALGQRSIGSWIIAPGETVSIGLPKAGRLSLRWKQPDGTPAARDQVVMGPVRLAL